MNSAERRRALVSVSDKTGLEAFVTGLVELGFEILSTGGTRTRLEDASIPVTDVAAYTGFPEMLDGRVKTLHPKVHGAILGRPDLENDLTAMHEHGIVPFQVVVCNLYPFEETIAKPGVALEEAIEQIDIGGPSMIRSAAKNHKFVAVVTDPCQYDGVLNALRADTLNRTLRANLATAAFAMTARYDRAINSYLAQSADVDSSDRDSHAGDEIPDSLSISLRKKMPLRYGENPHQSAAFFVEHAPAAATLASAGQIHGKELSYNNLLDLDSAMCIVRSFNEPSAVVIKHNNPCGCGIAESQADAFDKAYAGDPVSAFGSILGFNRELDATTAARLCEPNRFIEAIVAPGYSADALEMLTTKPKWKNNVRLLACPGMNQLEDGPRDLRRVSGGYLLQDRDESIDDSDEWKCVTEREPGDAEMRDLRFAWTVCRYVKSNAIVFARDGAIVGVGAGQMSRLDSVHIASFKSEERSRGSVVASDAFFPFRDGVDKAVKSGVTAVIQPGGSRNDPEVIAACNEHSLAMVLTGRRHFRH